MLQTLGVVSLVWDWPKVFAALVHHRLVVDLQAWETLQRGVMKNVHKTQNQYAQQQQGQSKYKRRDGISAAGTGADVDEDNDNADQTNSPNNNRGVVSLRRDLLDVARQVLPEYYFESQAEDKDGLGAFGEEDMRTAVATVDTSAGRTKLGSQSLYSRRQSRQSQMSSAQGSRSGEKTMLRIFSTNQRVTGLSFRTLVFLAPPVQPIASSTSPLASPLRTPERTPRSRRPSSYTNRSANHSLHSKAPINHNDNSHNNDTIAGEDSLDRETIAPSIASPITSTTTKRKVSIVEPNANHDVQNHRNHSPEVPLSPIQQPADDAHNQMSDNHTRQHAPHHGRSRSNTIISSISKDDSEYGDHFDDELQQQQPHTSPRLQRLRNRQTHAKKKSTNLAFSSYDERDNDDDDEEEDDAEEEDEDDEEERSESRGQNKRRKPRVPAEEEHEEVDLTQMVAHPDDFFYRHSAYHRHLYSKRDVVKNGAFDEDKYADDHGGTASFHLRRFYDHSILQSLDIVFQCRPAKASLSAAALDKRSVAKFMRGHYNLRIPGHRIIPLLTASTFPYADLSTRYRRTQLGKFLVALLAVHFDANQTLSLQLLLPLHLSLPAGSAPLHSLSGEGQEGSVIPGESRVGSRKSSIDNTTLPTHHPLEHERQFEDDIDMHSRHSHGSVDSGMSHLDDATATNTANNSRRASSAWQGPPHGQTALNSSQSVVSAFTLPQDDSESQSLQHNGHHELEQDEDIVYESQEASLAPSASVTVATAAADILALPGSHHTQAPSRRRTVSFPDEIVSGNDT